MILYVDSSVLLRVVLGERGRLREWRRSERWISSELVRLECLRTIDRAAEPFPTALGTLDALHLASALAAREVAPDLVFATHDRELGLAARSVGFRVLGVPRLA